MDTATNLDTLQLVIGLLGGLALFLYGMEQMADALKLVAGGGMKRLLARFTTNRFKAALSGAFVTAVVQSSSVTTVLVIGFISAGLMSLSQSVGFIMGANIGSTVTAQIIAFKVTQYALIPVAIGFAMSFISKKEKVRQYGAMLMGLGLIFFGMDLMSDATRPLRSYAPFIALMGQMGNPAMGILVSALFTGIIQSSAATTGVVIVLASQGFITLEAGIALVFGANIGTCVTALLAAIGKPREAVQASVVHILFNIIGVAIWLPFIDDLAWIVREVSPAAQGVLSTAQQATETPRQIANAHTIFNVVNTILFIGFTGPFAWLVTRMVPERPAAEDKIIQPRYLDTLLLDTPVLALDRVRMELRRVGERAHHMVAQALPMVFQGSKEDLLALAKLDDEIDVLHKAIVAYLGHLSQENLSTAQSKLLYDYITASNNIENIGDMIESNIVKAGLERLHTQLEISAPTQHVLGELHSKVTWAVQMALEALDASDPSMAASVIDAKEDINRLAFQAEVHLANRLAINEEDRLPLYQIESEITEYLKRVYYFAKRIAKGFLEDEGPSVSGDASPASVPVVSPSSS